VTNEDLFSTEIDAALGGLSNFFLLLCCRTISVAEREFVVADFVLLHAAWHPGSSTSTHLVILTSDNVLR